jgi:hypothetical protein
MLMDMDTGKVKFQLDARSNESQMDTGLLECHYLARNNKVEDATFSQIVGIS